MDVNSTSTYVNKASSNKGFSGLASGMDTESMVESMLSGTQNKIDKQNALKQQIEWKQEIYRDIITQINTFQSQYFGSGSSTNLLSQAYFNSMSAISDSNAFKVSATSSASAGNTALEVRRLATNSSVTSGTGVSGKLEGKLDVEALTQQLQKQLTDDKSYTVTFQVGDQTAEVNLRDVFVDGTSFRSFDNAVERDRAIQDKLNESLSDLELKATVTDGQVKITGTGDPPKTIIVTSDSGELGLQRLGLKAGSHSVNDRGQESTTLSGKVNETPALTFSVTLDDLKKDVKIDLRKVTGADGAVDLEKFKDTLQDALNSAHGSGQIKVLSSGDQLELSVSDGRKVMIGGDKELLGALGMKNGQSNRIGLGDTLKELYFAQGLQGSRFRFTINGEEFSFTENDAINDIMEAINKSDAGVRLVYRPQADTFTLEATNPGAGRAITMTQEEGNFLTALFGAGAAGSEILTGSRVVSTVLSRQKDGEETAEDAEEAEITGETTLEELGLTGLFGKDGQPLSGDVKLSELAEKTDGLSYEDGRIVLSAVGTGIQVGDAETMQRLFGADTLDMGVAAGEASQVVEGQNALIKIDGLITERSSNSFSVNGLNFDLRSITGSYTAVSGKLMAGTDEIVLLPGQYVEDGVLYNKDGTKLKTGITYQEADGFPVTATALSYDPATGKMQLFTGEAENVEVSRSTDQVVDGIKQFISSYNKLVQTLNGYLDEDASYRDYAPLTSEQKKEMSDREIELWEEKAKEGLLRRDSTIQTFLQSMRTALYEKPAGCNYALYELGIETGEWESKGQLVLSADGEARLRQILESDPTGVLQLFTDEQEGLSVKLNDILKKTANTSSGSPGTLVELAGVKGKATETDNTLYRRLQEIENKISALKRTYEKEKTRYWNQFNTMEQLVANMSTQSAYLAQMMGG